MNTIACLVGVFLLVSAPCAYSKKMAFDDHKRVVEKANEIFQKEFKDGKLVFDEKLVHIAMETACGKPPKDMGIIALGDENEAWAWENIAAHHDRVACISKTCESKKATTSILCVVAASKAPEKAAEKSDEKSDVKKDDEKKSGAQKIIGFSLVVLILGVLNY